MQRRASLVPPIYCLHFLKLTFLLHWFVVATGRRRRTTASHRSDMVSASCLPWYLCKIVRYNSLTLFLMQYLCCRLQICTIQIRHHHSSRSTINCQEDGYVL